MNTYNEFTKDYKTKDFHKALEYKVKYIEEVLNNYLPSEEGKQKIIFEAMNYSVLSGGKRIRPMLMMETYLLFESEYIEWLHPFMAAIEMIHSYSLVHDDLPAMDNDEFRRGRKTTHIKYGETIGILAGDALLNYAFETAIKSYYSIQEILEDDKNSDKNESYIYEYKDRAIRGLEILARKAGSHGMIGGQVIDTYILEGQLTQEKDKDKLLNTIKNMYKLKTGGLIQSSMMIGAILAGASKEELGKVEEMATYIGLAFQIQDDILDVTSTTKKLGKPVLSDERNEKSTYVSLLGLDKAEEEVSNYSNKALDIYKSFDKSNPYLYDLINRLINREK